MQPSLLSRLRLRFGAGLLAAILLTLPLLTVWFLTRQSGSPMSTRTQSITLDQFPAGPPWRYGRVDARFTLVLYADLECPYCKSYYPVLKKWVVRHPETNLQWHHLPLPMHEPAASRQARLAECAGKAEGHAAFWEAVTWIYQHTRSDGNGIPESARYPALTPTMQACLDSTRPDTIIEAQAGEGTREGVNATPTVKLSDNLSGRILVLPGPAEGDALLSALDLLSADSSADHTASPQKPGPVVDDRPK
ncbi:DsbA family protein [Serratia ficaria]|uniref:DsbA family protein n=1 Tax=Serratia ficaria TaxID=61651 RepID=UPI002183E151|nr:thioredoxin domain-containing protein [Serratia ficaria]CAI1234578.1 Protein-disulfide isomerase [Serratia ficaria]